MRTDLPPTDEAQIEKILILAEAQLIADAWMHENREALSGEGTVRVFTAANSVRIAGLEVDRLILVGAVNPVLAEDALVCLRGFSSQTVHVGIADRLAAGWRT